MFGCGPRRALLATFPVLPERFRRLCRHNRFECFNRITILILISAAGHGIAEALNQNPSGSAMRAARTRGKIACQVLRRTGTASRHIIMFAGSRIVQPPSEGSRRGDNPVIQLVGFRLDNEDYAIAITKIQEIILMKPITRIPQVPDFIEGLINLRGSVIPIVNLRKRFGLPAREVDDETRTIVVNVHDKTVGCIVDAVTQVMRINRDQIQPPPLSVLAVAHQYISGLARLDDRLLIILDIDRLFDEQSLAAAGRRSELAGLTRRLDPSGSSRKASARRRHITPMPSLGATSRWDSNRTADVAKTTGPRRRPRCHRNGRRARRNNARSRPARPAATANGDERQARPMYHGRGRHVDERPWPRTPAPRRRSRSPRRRRRSWTRPTPTPRR